MKLARGTRNWEHYYALAIRAEEMGYARPRHWYLKIPESAAVHIYKRYLSLDMNQRNEFWKNSKP